MLDLFYCIFFLLCSGFLSSIETALFSLTSEELILFKSGSFQERFIYGVMKAPEKLLIVILVSNNFVNIAIVLIGAFLMEQCFIYFHIIHWNWVLLMTQFITLTLSIFVFGELLPKNIALKYPKKVALIFIFPLYIIYIMMSITGICRLVSFSTSNLLWISRQFLGQPDQQIDSLSLQEGVILLQEKGLLSEEETSILYNLFKMQTVSIAEMMKHRSKVQTLSPIDNIEEIISKCLSSQQKQVPVYDSKKDQIIGVFNVRKALQKNEKGSIKKIMEPAKFLPMVVRSDSVLNLLSYQGDNLRILVNQFGEYEGILSSDMVIDFLSKPINQVDKWEKQLIGRVFDASIKIDKVEKLLKTSLPKGDYHTISGLILSQIKRIPMKGECILIKGWKFFIEEVESHRIVKVSIQ